MRLALDKKQIIETYPGLKYHTDEQTGIVYLKGQITLLAECGIPTYIPVLINFPDDYPQQEPRVYDIENYFLHGAERHFYTNGQYCLWLPPASRWNGKDPESLCRFLEEVVVFLDRQLVYDAEGKGIWPGKEWGHNNAGYLEFILDILDGDSEILFLLAPILAGQSKIGRNHLCPCESGRKYKKCHQDTVDSIRRKVGAIILTSLFHQPFKFSIVERFAK